MLKICLIGNPNSGKTTLFNNLTKSNARVGNWPGVTVEKREGTIKRKNKDNVQVVDLPGIYSLSPYTDEEVISRNYLISNQSDVVVNIVDATNLERNLYLTSQILEMDVNIVICLNFMDVVDKQGDFIDVEKLSKKFGVPIIPISALKSRNINKLLEECEKVKDNKRKGTSILNQNSNFNKLLKDVSECCVSQNVPSPCFHAIKFLENDELERKEHPFLERDFHSEIEEFKTNSNIENVEQFIAKSRFKIIENMTIDCIDKSYRPAYSFSDKVDKVFTNKYFGIPIFILIMMLVFQITFAEDFFYIGKIFNIDSVPSLGTYLQGLVKKLFELITGGIESGMTNINAPLWSISLINEGIFGAIGAVLSFLPQVLLLFLFIQILENSGYMSRVAFVFDRLLRSFGLSGKSLVPLISCFGCAVPGIMGTRTIESRKEKIITISLAPFFSCSAKLPIYLAFGSVVAGGVLGGAMVAFLIYFGGIFVAILAAFILNNTKYRGASSSFIMELPSYHIPQFKATSLSVLDELKKFMIRAGTLIACSSLVLWFLMNFNWSYSYIGGLDNGMEQSIIGDIGRLIQPIFVPLGFAKGPDGWKFVVAALTGLVAKEQVVASLELLSSSNYNLLLQSLNSAQIFSFLGFNLLTLPCVAAISAAKAELKTKKDFLFVLFVWSLASYVCSMFVYSFGALFEIANNYKYGVLEIICLIVSVAIIATLITLSIVYKNKKTNDDNCNNDDNDSSSGTNKKARCMIGCKHCR